MSDETETTTAVDTDSLPEFVKIKHPDLDSAGTCPRGALPFWQAKGFKLVEEDAQGDAASEPSVDPEVDAQSTRTAAGENAEQNQQPTPRGFLGR